MNLSQMTIRAKLTTGLSVLVATVVVISGVSLRVLSESTGGLSNCVHGVDARTDAANDVRTVVDRRTIVACNLVPVAIQKDLDLEKADVLRTHDDVKNESKQFNDMIVDAKGITDRARTLVKDINRMEVQRGPVATNIVGLALAGKRDETAQGMDNECCLLLTALTKTVDAYAAYMHEHQERFVQVYEAQHVIQCSLPVGLSIGAILLAMIAGIIITCLITQPIHTAADVAQTVARGDLSSRIEVHDKDKTNRLLSAPHGVNDRLTEIVGKVRNSSNGAAGVAKQIVAGNVGPSQRTGAQASPLQKTAASMEELTSTVKRNTENTQHATVPTSTTSEVALKGSAIVSQAMSTTQDVNDRSSKIADIIGIIKGIMFQTNILALDIAVEAARTDEQDRGFTVVASEVRSLAQYSPTATKKVKEPIASSVECIHDGPTLTGGAGETMTEVT